MFRAPFQFREGAINAALLPAHTEFLKGDNNCNTSRLCYYVRRTGLPLVGFGRTGTPYIAHSLRGLPAPQVLEDAAINVCTLIKRAAYEATMSGRV